VKKIHGSRDYFRIKASDMLVFEIVPVIKVKKPKDAYNITDLSYSHVKYINKKIKSKKIFDEVRLAKAFCYANAIYGAESHIKGFSGYSLELLIIYYKSFLNFLKKLSASKNKKIIIDIEKLYKNKNQILKDINESKLESPIILIDPTHKYRNVLAALSSETFNKFKKEAFKFLKNPSEKYFEVKTKNLEAMRREHRSRGYDSEILEIKTEKQEGAIAGSKLLKFFNYLSFEISKLFNIKEMNIDYGGRKSARIIFSAKRKKEIRINGPEKQDKENVQRFKEKHKETYLIGNRICCIKGIDCTLEDFLNNWIKNNKRTIEEMSISGIELAD
jgi:tRNA nucleotidyltransferase (CCA-adding enzyme)